MNSTDFFTLENIADIPNNEFFSYESDNNIWGFNILSIYNLFVKSENNVLNPYTREIMNYSILYKLKKLIRFNKLLNKPINIILNNNTEVFSTKKKIEMKCLELFQYMDELGNYTDCKWFTSLNRITIN